MKDLQVSQGNSGRNSASDIQGHLEAYEKLTRECRRYALLKENVEKERKTVQLQIYEKVKAEYEEKLAAVEKDLRKQEALLQEQIRELLERRADLDKLCRKDNERLEEIDFRTRVGEYTEGQCKEERSEIEKRALEQSQELAGLEEVVSRCRRAGLLPEEPSSRPVTETKEKDTQEPAAEKEEKIPADNGWPQLATQDPSPTAKEETEETEALEEEEVVESFQVMEDEPSADEPKAPVIHCPPSLSFPQERTSTEQETARTRRKPSAAPSEYVTGYLIALEGSRQGERFPMISSNITLGNSPGIDIRLVDPGIANFHARILYKERKHFLENLDSMGRSFVNGVQAVKLVELRDGDVIRLGDIKMQVEYASAKTTNGN